MTISFAQVTLIAVCAATASAADQWDAGNATVSNAAGGISLSGSFGTFHVGSTGGDFALQSGNVQVIGVKPPPQLPDIQATVGVPLNRHLVALWPVAGTWTAQGLPAGVTINGDALVGLPTTAGSFGLTLTFTNADGLSTIETVNILVAPAPVVTPVVLVVPDPVTGQPVAATSQDLTIILTTGSQFSYHVPAPSGATVDFVGPPPWITAEGKTGVFGGTVGDPGTYILTAIITGANNSTITTTITLVVSAPVAGANGFVNLKPTTTTMNLGDSFKAPLVVEGDTTGVRYEADGLPPGVVIDPLTGIISGHPAHAGTYLIRIRAVRYVVAASVNPQVARALPEGTILSATTVVLEVLDKSSYTGEASQWVNLRDNVTGQGGCGAGGIALIGVGLVGLFTRRNRRPETRS